MVVDKEELVQRYKAKIKEELEGAKAEGSKTSFEQEQSSRYEEFKRSFLPTHLNLYERACAFFEKFPDPGVAEKEKEVLEEHLETCHLNVSVRGVRALSIWLPLLVAVVGGLAGFIIPYMATGEKSLFFTFFFLLLGLVLMYVLSKLPEQFARNWRLAASNQMVISIFYIVTYMRHTSNLENAIGFATEHLKGPLALDLRKLLWQVENNKYESITTALDIYLLKWRDSNQEYVEAMNLIESSLFEPSNARRLTILDKSLEVILSQTEEKMLHYAQGITGPINMLHMMGVILPILGLVIMPLLVSIMGNVKWYYLATLYNVILPIGVFYLGRNILSTRPTGYGDVDISEFNPNLRKKKFYSFKFGTKTILINPVLIAIVIGVVLFFIGITPLIIHAVSQAPPGTENPPDICLAKDWTRFNPAINDQKKPFLCLLEYRKSSADPDKLIGPFGLGASILSIFVVLALGIPFGLYFKKRSGQLVKIRAEAKKVEKEFAYTLSQLGNRMGEGLPMEIAIPKVAATLGGTPSGDFLSLVSYNMSRLGFDPEKAIFDSKVGAIKKVPSEIIRSSMKVLIEAARKGPAIAAQALTNTSEYIKEIHRVNEKIKDLMAETIASMKSQVKFLAPGIAGVIVGITGMITYILGKLNMAQQGEGLLESGGVAAIFSGDSVPTYFFQIVVGIYIVQLIYILTVLANTIENGTDKLNEENELGKNMLRSTALYCFLTLTVMIIFNIFAGVILSRGGFPG